MDFEALSEDLPNSLNEPDTSLFDRERVFAALFSPFTVLLNLEPLEAKLAMALVIRIMFSGTAFAVDMVAKKFFSSTDNLGRTSITLCMDVLPSLEIFLTNSPTLTASSDTEPIPYIVPVKFRIALPVLYKAD
jgi:hypothetical protein